MPAPAGLRARRPARTLATRLESTLQELTELAAEELESWELSSMRDPRNWVRPVVAVAVGTAAGAGFVVLRVRSQHRKQRKHVQGVELAAAHDARRRRRGQAGHPQTLIRRPPDA